MYVSLSRNTIARRTEDLSGNIAFQLNADIQKCTDFSLQLDESVDVQLLVFIRATFDDFSTKESLVANWTLSQKTRGVEIYDALKELIAEKNIPIKKHAAITTDGAPSMVGKNVGLFATCEKVVNFPNFKSYHCVIHRQNLCGKVLK